MSLLSLLKIEFIKQKKSFLWKLSFITPIICFCILLTFWYFKYSTLINGCKDLGLNSQLDVLFFTNHLSSLWFILSTFSFSLISLGVNFIEHNENCWKYVLSLPIDRTKIYFSKWLVIFILSFVSIILNSIGFIGVSFIFKLENCLNVILIFKYIFFQILCSISIISFQHFICCYFKNTLIPLSISIIGIINTIMFSQSKILSILIPYVPTMNCVPLRNGNTAQIAAVTGLICGILWLLVGIIEFNKRDIK
ncbi:ABC transporter permease [Clostridium ganghwense]|uniref:ABC transporter permease n=1 Tax=Clostridium ganghwense TaxID=312089 RepID=A0ABT4CNI0_9CLOT|nr:ABC transporter permease [Clostridium ganghwense]MCY6370607.1 ABC transporter permease [Clostridium ganghwense]